MKANLRHLLMERIVLLGKIWTDDLMFGIVKGTVVYSVCHYGLSCYNYLSRVVLKFRLSVIITSLYILCIISFEPPTTLLLFSC